MAKSQFMQDALQARISLDVKRTLLESASKVLVRPRGGWIQAIRTGLGMSAADLAKRLGVSPSSIHRLEISETAGTINLESLKRVADELGCDMVYALVPRQDLEQVVKKRALAIATRKLRTTQATMALEQQALQAEVLKKLIEQKANELVQSRELWKSETQDVN